MTNKAYQTWPSLSPYGLMDVMQPQNPFIAPDPRSKEHFSPLNREAHTQPAAQPTAPVQSDANSPQPAPYDFIFNPENPTKKAIPLPGGSSIIKRVLFVVGGLFVLLIAFIVIKNLIVGAPKLDSMAIVAEDQQELIHLSSNAILEQDLSVSNQNLANTAKLSLASAQSQIFTYFTNNHFKVNTKTLGLKVSGTLDTQLANAETAGTYNQTFQATMKSKLSDYSNDLRASYQVITGKNGRALLSSDYNQAQLLLNQLSSPAS